MSMRVKSNILNELFRPTRSHYRRRQYTIKGLNDLWEIDLMDMKQIKSSNKGYQYVLVVIDAFSKYVYTETLKNKTGIEVTGGMKKILELGNIPNSFKVIEGPNSITGISEN